MHRPSSLLRSALADAGEAADEAITSLLVPTLGGGGALTVAVLIDPRLIPLAALVIFLYWPLIAARVADRDERSGLTPDGLLVLDDLEAEVYALAASAGVAQPRVLFSEDEDWAAAGRPTFGPSGVVFVGTDMILHRLTDQASDPLHMTHADASAFLAHEIGHLGRDAMLRPWLCGLPDAIGVLAAGMAAMLGQPSGIAVSAIMASLAWAIVPRIVISVRAVWSRASEVRADRLSARLVGPSVLAGALAILALDDEVESEARERAAECGPLGRAILLCRASYESWIESHPSTDSRIRRALLSPAQRSA